MSTNQLDIQVVNLAKAIRKVESGGSFDAKGKSGEIGAYQFMPTTWAGEAPKYGINVPIEQATPAQQNAVAYNRIKEWKDKGYNVTQIASMWNASEGEPNAYKGTFGMSTSTHAMGDLSKGTNFDVPGYAAKVAIEYKKLKSLTSTITPTPVVEEEKKQYWFQNMVTSAVSLPVNVYRIFKAAISLLEPGEITVGSPKYEALSELYKPVVLPLGLGTVDPLKEKRADVAKQLLGQTLQTEAWLIPGIGPEAKVSAKLLNWFGRGFSFGAGDTLAEGGTITDAIKNGGISGAATAVLGFSIDKIAGEVSSFATNQLKNPDSTYSNLKLRFIESYPSMKQLRLAVKDLDTPLYTNFINTVKTTITQEAKKVLSLSTLNKVLGVASLIYHPTRLPVLGVLAAKTSWTFFNTPSGRQLISNVFKEGCLALQKIEPITRNKIAVPFFTELLSEMTNSVMYEIEGKTEEE